VAGEEAWYRWQGDDLVLRIRLQPRASADEIVGVRGGALKIRTTAPPIDGKANEHVARYLAKVFGVARSRVSLISGHAGRDKRLLIQAPARLPAILADARPKRR
jgi:uncharacterized protein (TIGR00251 family)